MSATLTYTAHTLDRHHCSQCDALWSRTNNPPRQESTRIYPEQGWIPLIRGSIQDVFEIMLGCSVCVAHEPLSTGLDMFTATVGLAGKISGTMSVRCDEAAACKMASSMLGVEVTLHDPDSRSMICDALGEVCNMVTGALKARVPSADDGCSLSVPTVVTGGNGEIHSMANGERVMVSFTYNHSPVSVSLDLHE